MLDGARILSRGLLAVIGAMLLTTAQGRDRIEFPPELRSFPSPSGAYVLEVRAVDGGKQPKSHAELFLVNSEGRRSLWSAALPHRYGPGLAFVSDKGRALLIDEWMKTPSKYAVVLLAENGDTIARHSMSEIVALSGVPGSEVVTVARFGPWMSAPPALTPTQDSVRVEAGGVPLEISFYSGRISRAKSGKVTTEERS